MPPSNSAPVSAPRPLPGLLDHLRTPAWRSPTPKPGRRKLWEIPARYRCPVIGTCLSVAELRRLGDRHAERSEEPASDYEVHVAFVAAADERNSLSLAAHKAMDRKYQGAIKRFERARDPESLLALWSDCLVRGEVAGGFWALMTHPKADERAQRLAYEEVHMLSHQVGASQRADLRRLAETQEELESLRRDFDALHARARRQVEHRDALIRDLELRLCEREAVLTQAVARSQRLETLVSDLESRAPGERIRGLESRLAELESALEGARAERDHWRLAHGELEGRLVAAQSAQREREAECAALERLLLQGLAEKGGDACEGCSGGACLGRDLAGRMILCVGGRLAQVQQFARVVRECNGRFDHHDGGLEDRDRRLESVLAGADLVVCATDFVSHGAYHRTKRFCKRHARPHVLLQRSGLGAFVQALEQVGV